MALLEFLLTTTRARIVAANILQRVAYRILMGMVAVWTVHVSMVVLMAVIVIVIAVWAVNMWLV